MWAAVRRTRIKIRDEERMPKEHACVAILVIETWQALERSLRLELQPEDFRVNTREPGDKSVALCASPYSHPWRMQGPRLREYIEFYRLIGVSHFYFYVHFMSDNTTKSLSPYEKEGVATYELCPQILVNV